LKKYELSEKYFLLSIENGEYISYNNLALLYKETKKYELSEKYFLLGVSKNDNKGKSFHFYNIKKL
jgi:hypothetical protein